MQDTQNVYQELMLKAAQEETFREALLGDPKATLEAYLGTPLPEGFKINVVENTATELTLVIPPKTSDELSEDDLADVAGGLFGFRPKPGDPPQMTPEIRRWLDFKKMMSKR